MSYKWSSKHTKSTLFSLMVSVGSSNIYLQVVINPEGGRNEKMENPAYGGRFNID